ncbi:transcriptional regulator, LysR family [Geomicrobium sp. JCM 19037]|uniref:LysR family transcriptional regulator n=1 Tax=unclassified Geomicrobium TaxID=2628951 RepID=UPI00045F25FA|nr:LysR family transcriptional regulator [Geomicrobium sp. JCM 19037]GAK03636.1 transcriptional regulator, LysR family [Geomicrobium sp. JCM 19037]
MNEYQLQTFLAIAKHKSYSKAAESLNVTQPTVTSRMKSLEEILKCTLFNRVGHEIFLTREGDMFKDYAKNILIYINQSKEITNITKDPAIRVGFSPGYSYSFIVELLKTIKSLGNINIQIIEGYDSVNLNERVLAGEIDMIFARNVLSKNSDIDSEYLFSNELVVVLPTDHPLCNKPTITLEDLHGETMISFRRNTELWRLIDQVLIGARGLTRIDVDNNEMLLKAVAHHIGIGIIPELGIDETYSDGICTRKVDEISSIPNSVYVQYRKTPHIRDLAKKIIYTIINHKYSGT